MTRIDMAAVPAARMDDLVMTESGDEVLIYDQRAHHIHHLNRVSAVIWRLCDGRRFVGEISAAATREMGIEVSEDAVKLALRKLADADLLSGEVSVDIRGSSRRAFMKRAAIAGMAVPAIVSMTAPQASAANSCAGNDRPSGCACENDQQCQSGVCVPGALGGCQ